MSPAVARSTAVEPAWRAIRDRRTATRSPTSTTSGTRGSAMPSVSADVVADLAAASAAGTAVPRVLELAVGTGRLALPLADRGARRRRDRRQRGDARPTAGQRPERSGDDRPRATWSTTSRRVRSTPCCSPTTRCSTWRTPSVKRRASRAVAARLAPGGVFVVEAFVPEEPPREGTVVAVRSMTAAEVVLSISEHDPADPARRRPLRAVHRRRAGAPAAVGDPLRTAGRARRDGGGSRARARRPGGRTSRAARSTTTAPATSASTGERDAG